ncbi:MAG: hypothetical protein JXA37_04985, partial [Chloroflexia bacterium]|nr:hypothetical protein [Chloroflexia bacterium]
WRAGLRGFRQRGSRRIDPGGARAWLPGRDCLWRRHGVWEEDGTGQPRLARPDYFCRVEGRNVDFYPDYFRPFANRYARAIRALDSEALIFVEGVPGDAHIPWGQEDAADVVHAAHWYDGPTLYLKRYVPWFTVDTRRIRLVLGRRRVERMLVQQVADIMQGSAEMGDGLPTLIGEFGIPFDMHGGAAYRSGDFGRQIAALDRSFRVLEANLVGGTLWNYTADNDNERGDQWNGEDLSLFSRDQQSEPVDLDSGGRALEAAVRPYARAVAGEPLRMAFDLRRRRFELLFRHDPAVSAPSEIFVPELQYRRGCAVAVSDGRYELQPGEQRLLYWHTSERDEHRVVLEPA